MNKEQILDFIDTDFIDTKEFDNFLKTLKIHNKDLTACFNDALASEHLRKLFIKTVIKSLDNYASKVVGDVEKEIYDLDINEDQSPNYIRDKIVDIITNLKEKYGIEIK